MSVLSLLRHHMHKEISTPTSPASGFHALYFKSDGKLYTLNSSGTEVEVMSNVKLDYQSSVLSIATAASAPPTEVLGNRYILSATGTPHANWDTCTNNDVAEFNGTKWVPTNPTEGMICEVEDVNTIYLFLTSWAAWQNQATTTTSNVQFASVTVDNTGLHILDTNASHDLIIVPGSNLSADRNFTITTGDAARTLTMNENFTVGDGYDVTITAEDATGSITLDNTTFEVENANATQRLLKLVVGTDAAATLTVEGTAGVVNQDVTSDASPTFTAVNKVAITAPATSATLTIVDGTTLGNAKSVVTHSGSEAITAAQMYGSEHILTAVGTLTLPALAVGMNAVFTATTAAVMTIDSNGADQLILGGTALTAGYSIDSDGSAYASCEIVCLQANKGIVRNTNCVFIDGGAS